MAGIRMFRRVKETPAKNSTWSEPAVGPLRPAPACENTSNFGAGHVCLLRTTLAGGPDLSLQKLFRKIPFYSTFFPYLRDKLRARNVLLMDLPGFVGELEG